MVSINSPVVEARSAEDPGSPAIRLIDTTPTGCRSLGRSSITSDPWRGRGDKGGLCFPGVVGAAPLRHPGYEKRTPPGCPLTGRAILSDESDGAEVTCSHLGNPSISAVHAEAGLFHTHRKRSFVTSVNSFTDIRDH